MDLPAFLALPPGLIVGMIVLGPLLRWGIAIWTVAKERRRDPAHRSAWRIPVVVLLHSGPWFAIVAGGFAWFILSKPHHAAWNWFFGGALLAPLVFGFYAWKLLKMRKARLKAAQQQPTSVK